MSKEIWVRIYDNNADSAQVDRPTDEQMDADSRRSTYWDPVPVDGLPDLDAIREVVVEMDDYHEAEEVIDLDLVSCWITRLDAALNGGE